MALSHKQITENLKEIKTVDLPNMIKATIYFLNPKVKLHLYTRSYGMELINALTGVLNRGKCLSILNSIG